jgi:hypothetical protein
MPLGDSEKDHQELLTWGDASVDWLVEAKFPKLDAAVVKNQALKVRMYVQRNKSRWTFADDVGPKEQPKPPYLHLTGVCMACFLLAHVWGWVQVLVGCLRHCSQTEMLCQTASNTWII